MKKERERVKSGNAEYRCNKEIYLDVTDTKLPFRLSEFIWRHDDDMFWRM